jgi:hypothetical protein
VTQKDTTGLRPVSHAGENWCLQPFEDLTFNQLMKCLYGDPPDGGHPIPDSDSDGGGFPDSPQPGPCDAAEAHMVAVCSAKTPSCENPAYPRVGGAVDFPNIESLDISTTAESQHSHSLGVAQGMSIGLIGPGLAASEDPAPDPCRQNPHLCDMVACPCLGGEVVTVLACRSCDSKCSACYEAMAEYQKCLDTSGP